MRQLVRFLLLIPAISAAFALILLAPDDASAQNGATLELKKGDHIAIIGNTLADRLQHDGWLEALIQAKHPEHELVVRSLGFSSDTLTMRLRNKDFGTPDDWLNKVKADVILMMFGFGESFDNPEDAAEKFRTDLVAEISKLKSQNYNGQSPPRLAIISPIAMEQPGVSGYTGHQPAMQRLREITEVSKKIADENSIPFVDLFGFTSELFQQEQTRGQTAEPFTYKPTLTINGVHLTEKGNQLVAESIVTQLFDGKPMPVADAGNLCSLNTDTVNAVRTAVKDKNFYWYNRYRTTDGYSIYGGRADLRFVEGQTNREVMDREMLILEMMADNRDPVIHAAAAGVAKEADDSNLPEFVPVVTNKPGEGPDGEHLFLTGDESAAAMNMLDGFEVNLFADEEMFPELINPVQMAIDPRGRVWVATWESYPHWKPRDPMNDKLLILEDTDGDGRADVCKQFATGLHNPTGFEFWGGGVLVANAPDILFLEDTDGDDVADKTTRVLSGLDTADTHHSANSFTFGPDGGIYFQEGVFQNTQVESLYGTVRNINAAVYRFDPRTHKFTVYTRSRYANPHGHVFDRYGQDIIHDGTGATPYHGALVSGRIDFPEKHKQAPVVYNRRIRPCPATEVLSSDHFPESMQDELLVLNVIGDLGILRYRIDAEGASISGTELEPLMLSDEPSFRPVDAEFGARGELFFCDWQNPVIGHMQHNLRDPSRDNVHGRVFRITRSGVPLENPVAIAGQPIGELLELLKSPTNRIRHRVRVELSARDSDDVAKAAIQWVAGLDDAAPESDHHKLEALWVSQQHNRPNVALMNELIQSDDFRIRAAAARVNSYWLRDDALMVSAADDNPRVRLEAARGATYFSPEIALPALAKVLEQPTDKYLNYVLDEALRAFPKWKADLASGRMLYDMKQSSAEFLLSRFSVAEIDRLQPSAATMNHLLMRNDTNRKSREKAIAFIAESKNQTPVAVLLDAIETLQKENRNRGAASQMVNILAGYDSSDLVPARDRLTGLATSSPIPLMRRVAMIGMINADDSTAAVLKLASENEQAKLDLIEAAPLVRSPRLQLEIYPTILEAATNKPDMDSGDIPLGRFIRIELPGAARTLTLAEVEVSSGGTNIARGGKATQSSVSHNGAPERAIDGNTSPLYTNAGQTHTTEGGANPWWELDLGSAQPVDSIKIFNRMDEGLGNRLSGFTLKVLADDRSELFARTEIEAPRPSTEFAISTTPMSAIMKIAAIDSMTQVRGKEAEAFEVLSEVIVSADESDRMFQSATIQSMRRIGQRHFTAERASQISDELLDRLTKMPVDQRNSTQAADIIQLVSSLAAVVPEERAAEIRNMIDEIGVRIVRIGTRPHRMSYDREKIVVQAGRAIEFIFENTDQMPHNLVVTKPGSMERVGLAGEKMSQDKNAMALHYVPRSGDVLMSTKLVQPGENDRVTFEVPNREGIYPYVCTYPGHWRRMFGSLVVVKDTAAYSADPDGYAKANKLEIKDELIGFGQREPTEWKLANFESAWQDGSEEFQGRNFSIGENIFEVASCISCHQMNGKGYAIGPDLTKDLDPEWQPKDILESMIHPSKKIDDKYRNQIFALDDGDIVSGVVVKEDKETIELVENPLATSEPKVIDVEAVEARRMSDVSVMPEALLNTLTRDEILDLLAYIVAKGDKEHELFQGHDH